MDGHSEMFIVVNISDGNKLVVSVSEIGGPSVPYEMGDRLVI